MKKPLWIICIVAGVAILCAEGYATLRRFHKPLTTAPTAIAKQGDINLKVYATGTVNPQKIARLLAPRVTGGAATIVKLLPTGSRVKAGDVVVAFDPSGEEYNLRAARAQLEEADEAIAKAADDAKVQAAEDQSQLLTDKYDVDKAEITVSTNELLSKIQAEQNTLALGQAKRTLAELEADLKSHVASGQASLAVARQDKQKALFAIQQAQRDIKNMTVRSPLAGLVELGKNYSALGGFRVGGQQIPDFRVGDEAYTGTNVAQVIDPTATEIRTSVTETDRANIRAGQAAAIQVDSIPGKVFPGKITAIAGAASRGSIFSGRPSTVPMFALTIQFKPPANLPPGATVHVLIQGTVLTNALYVPPQAVFQVNGNPVVYVKQGSGFRAQRVKITYHSATATVIEGVQRGALVALVNPQAQTPGAPSARTGMELPQGGQ